MGVPEQPTLRDGDVVLRPWSDDDIEGARLAHDEEMSRWFGFPAVIPTRERHADAIRSWHEAYADDRRVVNFVVVHNHQPAGSVEVRQVGDRRGELSWTLYAGFRGRGLATTAVRMLMRYAFEDLGLIRLEAHVDPANVRSLRLAAHCGMRREGLLRRRETVGGVRRDHVLLARLADDPAPQSRDGFIGLLNAALPTKRVIAQGILRNDAGQVLLCELTYKRDWDLPGGVVEPGESPAQGLVREVHEELGIAVEVQRLATVNWLPPWRGWDDACTFVFELGMLTADQQSLLRLQLAEVVAVHWCGPDDVAARGAPATATMLSYLATHPSAAPYLEIGAEPPVPYDVGDMP